MHDQPNVPYGYCQCGCGGQTTIARQGGRGQVAGQPYRFRRGHHQRTRNVPLCGYFVEDRGYTTPCWVWGLERNHADYGLASRNGRTVSAHITFWIEARGSAPPPGVELDHLCRVRACVNPDHLEPVTSAINIQRSALAKLTQADVDAIRAITNMTQAAIGRLYGVSQQQVCKIRRGQRWRVPISQEAA